MGIILIMNNGFTNDNTFIENITYGHIDLSKVRKIIDPSDYKYVRFLGSITGKDYSKLDIEKGDKLLIDFYDDKYVRVVSKKGRNVYIRYGDVKFLKK